MNKAFTIPCMTKDGVKKRVMGSHAGAGTKCQHKDKNGSESLGDRELYDRGRIPLNGSHANGRLICDKR
jgi:hypothetical protein